MRLLVAFCSFFFMANRLAGFFSLGQNINKQRGEHEEIQEGVVSELLPELSVNISDDELLELKTKWEKKWNGYFPKIEKQQDDSPRAGR